MRPALRWLISSPKEQMQGLVKQTRKSHAIGVCSVPCAVSHRQSASVLASLSGGSPVWWVLNLVVPRHPLILLGGV